MTTGQTIETKIVVDAKQATAEVDKFTGKLSAVEEKAKASGFSLSNLQEQAKGLQSKLGPAAAAISGVAGALGETNGEAGKALAAIGQVTAAFAAGGPFGAAMAAGTFAVDAFSNALEKKNRLQMAAIDAEFAQTDAITKTTRELRQQAASLRLQLEPLSPAEIRKQAQERIKEIEKQRMLNAADAEYARRNDAAKAKSLLDQNKILEDQKELIFEIADLQARMLERGAPRSSGGARAAAQAAGYAGDPSLRFLAEFKKQRDQREREMRGEALAAAFEDRDALIEAEKEAQKERTRIAKEEADKRAAIAEAEQEAQVAALTSLASGAASAVGRFAAEAAMGQEAALSTLLSAASQAAGGQIVLEGGKVLSTGIAGAFVGNPAAPGQIAGGLALVAAGTAVQTGGPAAVQSLLGMAGGGGGASGAARDRGASPRSSRGDSGGGGPLVVNVSYGVGGPLPEDTAREIARAMKAGNRRRGAA
jgi:hypothetical protein